MGRPGRPKLYGLEIPRIDIEAARRLSRDPRAGSQLGILELRGQLTQREADVGRKVAAIYRAHDRAIGAIRTPKSQAWEVGLGKSPEATETDRDRDTAIHAREAFSGLQWLMPTDRATKDALVTLCVQDEAIAPYMVPLVRNALRSLAKPLLGRPA